jgi:hypothetical protein
MSIGFSNDNSEYSFLRKTNNQIDEKDFREEKPEYKEVFFSVADIESVLLIAKEDDTVKSAVFCVDNHQVQIFINRNVYSKKTVITVDVVNMETGEKGDLNFLA